MNDCETDYESGEWVDDTCTFCGGDGYSECDDPIQCMTPGCTGDYCMCLACYGRGFAQVIW